MKVYLVKRKRVVHVGMKIRDPFDDKLLTISVCNRTWNCEDKISEGDSSEVTCKRCQKYAKEAEEGDGTVELKPIKRRGRSK